MSETPCTVGIASLCYPGPQNYLGPQLGRFEVWWWIHNWELEASWVCLLTCLVSEPGALKNLDCWPEHLHTASPCSMASSQFGSLRIVTLGLQLQAFQLAAGCQIITFYHLTSEITFLLLLCSAGGKPVQSSGRLQKSRTRHHLYRGRGKTAEEPGRMAAIVALLGPFQHQPEKRCKSWNPCGREKVGGAYLFAGSCPTAG